MKKCKSCQSEIDPKAIKCPHCQADQRNWFGRHKIVTGIILFIVIMGVIGNLASSSSDTKSPKATLADQSQKNKPTVTLAPTTTPAPSPTTEPFDKEAGNNPVAAKYAQQLIDTFGKYTPGLITDVYIELSPEDMAGKPDIDYQKTIQNSKVTIKVDTNIWENNMGDMVKKEFVSGMVKFAINNIGGLPYITVFNGTKTVAEGKWSNGQPEVTLE